MPDDPAFRRVLAEAAEVAGLLWERGWAECNAGNLSCDVTDLLPASGPDEWQTLPQPVSELAGRRLLVTTAGSRMRDVAKAPGRWCVVLEFGPDGAGFRVARPGGGGTRLQPTSELPAHLAIHAALRRRGTTHRAVVHAHPTELLAISHDRRLLDEARLNALLWSLHPEEVVVLPDGVAVVPYALPGSAEQGRAAGAAMERHDVALWEKHGAVAVGADPAGAFDLIDTVNKAAQLLLLCRSAGYDPEGLSASELGQLRRAFPPQSAR